MTCTCGAAWPCSGPDWMGDHSPAGCPSCQREWRDCRCCVFCGATESHLCECDEEPTP